MSRSRAAYIGTSQLLCLLAASLGCGRPRSPEAEPTLKLHYTFDDCTADDASGNQNHGIIHGAASCSSGRRGGQALDFDGETVWVSLPGIRGVESLSQGFSVTGWMRVVHVQPWVPILTLGDSESMTAPFAVLYERSQAGLVAHVRLTDKNGRSFLENSPSVAAEEGIWVAFAWVFRDGIVTVYRDGATAATVATGLSDLGGTALPIAIGRDRPGALEMLKGSIDELRFYDVPLSPEQVQALYQTSPQSDNERT